MKNSSILKVLLAASLLVCLFDMPYGYYQFVRFFGMIAFGYLAYTASASDSKFYLHIWGASALLINPFFKISLGREIWNILDVVWAVVLILSVKTEKAKQKS